MARKAPAADPHAGWWDKHLENAIIGQLLMNDKWAEGSYAAYTAAGLRPEHFQQVRSQVIWQAAQRLAEVD
jgi:hypothetical protein